ncbi:MAG: carbohydrate ABC transporter permease [Bacillota bacterium]
MPVQSATKPSRTSNPIASLIVHSGLVIAALLALVPFLWLLCATLKRGEDLFSYAFLPWDHLDRLTLQNFKDLFTKQPFGTWLLNSLFLASTQTVLVVTFSSLGGFALAKYRFKGKRVLMLLMLATLLLPSQVLLTGGYELMFKFGWIDSYAAILVPGSVSVFGMFLFRQAMQSVPDELLQAGRVDGCSELRLWWEIALPIVRPMIGAFTLMSFLACWNSFLWPQIMLQNELKYTLPMGLSNMSQLPEYREEFGILLAGTLLSLSPVVILFFVLQKDFIAGLTTGAVKG